MDENFNVMETPNIACNYFFDNFLYHKCLVSSTKSLTSTRNLSAQILLYPCPKIFKIASQKKFMRQGARAWLR